MSISSRSNETVDRLSVAYLLTPALALAIFSLPICELPPMRTGTNTWQWIVAVPWWLGVACAPGYIYVWSERWRSRSLKRRTLIWVHASLLGATLSSFAGAILGLLTAIFWVFPAISGVLAIQVWLRFIRSRRSALNIDRPPMC